MNTTFNTNDFETTATATTNTQQTNRPFYTFDPQQTECAYTHTPSTQQTGPAPQQKQKTFDPLPFGTYKCSIDRLELQQDKKSRYVIFTQFRIVDGTHHNRCIFKRVYLSGCGDPAKMQKWANKYLAQLANNPRIEIKYNTQNDLVDVLTNIVAFNHNTEYWVKTAPSNDPAFTDVFIMGAE